jgi:hypothetical protein
MSAASEMLLLERKFSAYQISFTIAVDVEPSTHYGDMHLIQRKLVRCHCNEDGGFLLLRHGVHREGGDADHQ